MANVRRYPFHLMLAGEVCELSLDDVKLTSLRTYLYGLGRRWGVAFRATCNKGDACVWVKRLTACEAADEGRVVRQRDDQPAGIEHFTGAGRTSLSDWELRHRKAALASYPFPVTSDFERRKAEQKDWDHRFRRHFEGWVLRDSVRVLPAIPDEDDE